MNTERNDLEETLEETLEKIAQGSRRSKIVRLREIFDQVEAIKAKGATNKEIVAGLAKHNLIFDVPNFKNARSRILKERAMQALAQAIPVVNESKSACSLPKPEARATNAAVPSKRICKQTTSPEKHVGEVQEHAAEITSGGEKNSHPAASGGNAGNKTVTGGSRRPQLLSNDKGIYGDLNPSPVDGIVDLKQE